MAHKNKRKGSYHERWWCDWFNNKGIKAKRVPLSGALGGEFSSDITIETKHGIVKAESKYVANGTGFSFLTKTHTKQPADIYLLKQKTGPNFLCFEVDNKILNKILKEINGE